MKWIPIKTRKPTKEEVREAWNKNKYMDLTYILDCPLPEIGKEVLVTTEDGYVDVTVLRNYCGLDYCYFEYYECDGSVIAWMELPTPYKVGEAGSVLDSDNE